MNLIKNKLHSKRGASLLIAMVYLIFAVFVGGSVLAAASANGYRIEHLSDQQDYLNQRSAALLLAEEMDIGTFSNISLDAKYIITTREPVKVHLSGAEVPDTTKPTTVTHSLNFEARTNGELDVLGRLMFETAILRYMAVTDTTLVKPENITIKGLVYNGQAITSISQFWTVNDESCSGEIKINGTKGTETEPFTEYTARYRCGAGDQLYDFIVDFGDYSQLTITMNGYSGIRNQPSVPELEDAGDGTVDGNGYQHCHRVTTETERTTIAWNRPVIAKGGTK